MAPVLGTARFRGLEPVSSDLATRTEQESALRLPGSGSCSWPHPGHPAPVLGRTGNLSPGSHPPAPRPDELYRGTAGVGAKAESGRRVPERPAEGREQVRHTAATGAMQSREPGRAASGQRPGGHLPGTLACTDYTRWKAALWASGPFYSVRHGTDACEGRLREARGGLTSLPRLNSLNQEPGFSLGQEVILA